jgi:hypothetical protein
VPVVVPARMVRRPVTVYECDGCGARSLGSQYCEECRTFMRRVGFGGCCPACDEPVAIDDLLEPSLLAGAAPTPPRGGKAAKTSTGGRQ